MLFEEDPLSTPNHKTTESANATYEYWVSFMPGKNPFSYLYARVAKANGRKSGMVSCRSLTTTSTLCHHQWLIMGASSILLPSFINFTA